MRIIAGTARGRKLAGPGRGAVTRPMTDRAREGLFSSIAAHIPGADVLDLYAGSGSLGLESLSRGAASATFVENDRAVLGTLRANIDRLELGGVIVAQPVESFVERDAGHYDLVFVDPPYSALLAAVSAIMGSLVRLLRPGALVVLHRRRGEQRPQVPGLEPAGERTYGTTQLWRYVKEKR